MGGDHAPDMVIKGAAAVLPRFPQVRFILFGDAGQIEPLLRRFPALQDKCELRHTSEKVASEEKPGLALRRGRNTSMRLAIDAVARSEEHTSELQSLMRDSYAVFFLKKKKV